MDATGAPDVRGVVALQPRAFVRHANLHVGFGLVVFALGVVFAWRSPLVLAATAIVAMPFVLVSFRLRALRVERSGPWIVVRNFVSTRSLAAEDVAFVDARYANFVASRPPRVVLRDGNYFSVSCCASPRGRARRQGVDLARFLGVEVGTKNHEHAVLQARYFPEPLRRLG